MRNHLIGVGRLLATGVVLAEAALIWSGRAEAQSATSDTATQRHGIIVAYRDTTCAPCRDFYQYANGGWTDTASMPADRGRWGNFSELAERNLATLHHLLDSLSLARTLPGTNDWKVAHYYATCMDSVRADAHGAKPLAAELARIDAIASVGALRAEVARLHRMGVDALFGFSSAQDAKHSREIIGDARQGGLGLPERDFYLRTDSTSAAMRDAYIAHVARTLELTGVAHDAVVDAATRIMAIETQLARVSMTLTERRDPQAVYHKMTIAELTSLAPELAWPTYFRDVGRPDVQTVNVQQPAFFSTVNGLVTSVPLADWKSYLRWSYTSTMAPWLSSDFVNEDFGFASRLTGATAKRPRWKRCIAQTDRGLGEALGQAYTRVAFPLEAKEKALALVRNLEGVLTDKLRTLAWMNDSTRRQALVKLAAFRNKIGYPEHWRDYSRLVVRDGPFVDNVVASTEFETARQLAKIGRPLDRNEWTMTPPTVNAYYNSNRNEIVFPAGILQPPFFDPAADDASNYGAMGAVIGHEMTHGFDDRGRQFDAEGNLRDWWTPSDASSYTQRASLVVKQFDAFVVVDTLHIHGKQTLGENIADLGGLRIAYAAMERGLAGHRRPLIDGLTPEQRFFIAFAQVWREVNRPEALRSQLQTDVHSPGKWRVNGPLANIPEFAQAFGCRAGDPLVRPDSLRAEIW